MRGVWVCLAALACQQRSLADSRPRGYPCDIFGSAGTPCVAAHSTVRALYAAFSGPLYAVKRIGNDGCGNPPGTLGLANTHRVANSTGRALCGCTPDGNSVDLTCPAGGTIVAVTFASIGTPSGTCGQLEDGACKGKAGVAKAAVEKLCVGQQSCTVVADIQHMNGGADPCVGVPKSIAVEVQCSTAVPQGGDGKSLDINVTKPGGFADAAAQDKFCANAKCVFTKLYDQSPEGNHLAYIAAKPWTLPADAMSDPLTVGGHKVYGLRSGGDGDHPGSQLAPSAYRRDNATGTAVGDEAETLYMVVNGSHYNSHCCFDYGNAETNDRDDGAGTMEAIYFGTANGGENHGGAGAGPWIMGDMENALWGANKGGVEQPINHSFVTAMLKGDSGKAPGHFAIKGADAQSGVFRTYWDGQRAAGYAPMKKQGAIILGIGGDNSDGAVGTFYEGAMTKGYSTDAADAAVQASIVSVGYS